MRFIDFFAGIGGIRLGLEQAGHTCIGFCEYDKYARQSYKAMYDTEGEWEEHDIRTVESVPDADLWCFGFPCQDISNAGKQAGLERGSRSNLFFEIIRLLKGKENKPEWLICENVKHLLYINRGFDFARVLFELGELGYDTEWQLINSKDYGVPQNRERVFIIGHHREYGGREVLPISGANGENPIELQELTKRTHRCKRLYASDGLSCAISAVGGGEEKEQAFIDLDEGGKITDNARSVLARYHKGPMMSSCAANSGVVEFIDLDVGGQGVTEVARSLQARYNKGPTHNRKAEVSGIIEDS